MPNWFDNATADGWIEHPTASGWHYRGQEVISDAELKKRYARKRSTKAEKQHLLDALKAIVEETQPTNVRGVYYQADVRGLVDKTLAGYLRVQRALSDMRKSEMLPYDWIVDLTRQVRGSYGFTAREKSLTDRIRSAYGLSKSVWDDVDEVPQIWIEKDALVGVIEPVTYKYSVPLYSARGYSSITFLHEAAKAIEDIGKPVYIYHFGDYDPSGRDAARQIEEGLQELAPTSEIHFDAVAIWGEPQIKEYNLPTRPTKMTDSRAVGHGDVSVELDAIPAPELRRLVEEAINNHMTEEQLEEIKASHKKEQDAIERKLGQIADLLETPSYAAWLDSLK